MPRQGGAINTDGKATGALPRPRPLQFVSASHQGEPAAALAPLAPTPKPIAAPPQHEANVVNVTQGAWNVANETHNEAQGGALEEERQNVPQYPRKVTANDFGYETV
eukprot:10066904-Karenia_brevis.AAC.1